MLFRLLLLLTLLPLVELTLLAWLGAHTDSRLTVLFVIGTGVLGAWLIRSRVGARGNASERSSPVEKCRLTRSKTDC
jgi:UPF0716 family protein affecting phage T7 exclusion